MRFLVVGSGRSGTGHTAHLLRAAGVYCGHEQVFDTPQALGEAPANWGDYQADSSWLAVPCLPVPGVPAVLVVRHPLAVVKSMVEIGLFDDDRDDRYTRVIRRHAPHVWDEGTVQDRALAMWLHWNTTAAAHAIHTVRLEALDGAALAALLAAVDAPTDRADDAVREMASRPRYNTKADEKHVTYAPGWDRHRPGLAASARRLAARFGYQGTP